MIRGASELLREDAEAVQDDGEVGCYVDGGANFTGEARSFVDL